MISKELIRSFFKEQFEDVSSFFLYKDHQLLKENRFQEFMDRQLKKSYKRFIYGMVPSILCLVLGLAYFWFNPLPSEFLNIATGLFWISAGIRIQFWVTKQYFIIKSSMSLFQKMLAETED